MKLLKGLMIVALLSGMTMTASASEIEKEQVKEGQGTWILGDIVIKRPPINDDGPGGKGGN